MLKKILFFIMLLLAPKFSLAAMADYKDAFKIDLEAPLPTYDELFERFMVKESIYDTRYTSTFDIGDVFDEQFYATIATYGISEKRVKWDNEDEVLDMLNSVPKEMYEYIGPMLHKIPNMSEKILNMPGIKETKNRFPTRIAPQLKDVEDLEFLSPYLYFVLMPEAWPSDINNIEYPQMRRAHPKIAYDEKFYTAIKKLVPAEQYMSNIENKKLASRSDLRTIDATPDSLLTSADVQAFIATLDKVQDWGKQGDNMFKLYQLTSMLNDYEQSLDEPNKIPVNALKDLVNPCQRLVQKVRIMGKEYEFAMLVGGQGFTLNEWAYTCDKTIKAYRVSLMSSTLLKALRAYQNGSDDVFISKMSPRGQSMRYSTMQSILEMHKAPLNDVLEVRKNRDRLHKKWQDSDFKLLGVPLGRLS